MGKALGVLISPQRVGRLRFSVLGSHSPSFSNRAARAALSGAVGVGMVLYIYIYIFLFLFMY